MKTARSSWIWPSAAPGKLRLLPRHADVKKRGFSWNDPVNYDIHNSRGMNCAQCHPAIEDKKLKITKEQHNFAKGEENVSTVADNLDYRLQDLPAVPRTGLHGRTPAPPPEHQAQPPG